MNKNNNMRMERDEATGRKVSRIFRKWIFVLIPLLTVVPARAEEARGSL